jgi:hypothetical protein
MLALHHCVTGQQNFKNLIGGGKKYDYCVLSPVFQRIH